MDARINQYDSQGTAKNTVIYNTNPFTGCRLVEQFSPQIGNKEDSLVLLHDWLTIFARARAGVQNVSNVRYERIQKTK